jgi:outer membrane lipoprotein-sorting protein
MAIILGLVGLYMLMGCSLKPDREQLLESMLERAAGISSYQLEAELQIDGERFLLRQWYRAPDGLRTVVSHATGLEQIVVSAGGVTKVYFESDGKWVSLREGEEGPFSYGIPLLLFLTELARDETIVTETFSSIKISARGAGGWDHCEVVISLRSRLPVACTLTKGSHEVKIQIISLTENVRLSMDLFSTGQ